MIDIYQYTLNKVGVILSKKNFLAKTLTSLYSIPSWNSMIPFIKSHVTVHISFLVRELYKVTNLFCCFLQASVFQKIGISDM
jgi:hypothetical protein